MRILSVRRPAARVTRSSFARASRIWSKQWGSRRSLGLLGLAAVLTAAPAGPLAFAQGYSGDPQPSGLGGFMQGLLGGASAPVPAPPLYPQSPAAYPSRAVHSPSFARPAERSLSPLRSDTQEMHRKASPGPALSDASSTLGGGLRTMCVRMCDGYYWPVTFDARRSRFDRDAKTCSSSCTSEARLFVMPKNGEAKDMVDLQGRPYGKLVNAYRYRKLARNSCTCRPDPWEDSARARHEAFAASGNTPAEAFASEREPSEPTSTAKPMSIADAEAMFLKGGPVGTQTVIPDTSRVPVADAAPTKAVVAAGDAPAGSSTSAELVATATEDRLDSKAASPRAKSGHRVQTGQKTTSDRQRLVAAHRLASPQFTLQQYRTYPPAVSIRQYAPQPYLIGQPRAMPYRTY